jgi:uncharacterized membrane protein
VPTENIVIRAMIICSIILLIIVLSYYPPQFAVIPIVFIVMSTATDILMPRDKELLKRSGGLFLRRLSLE